MRTRQYVTVAALSTLLTLGLGGCILGSNPGGGGGSGADTEAVSGDTGPDSPGDAVSDTGVDGSDSECTRDDQCTDGPDNMSGTCSESGTCVWSCQGDYVDEDGDRSNGCECKTSDQSSYVVDSDEDGFPEEDGESKSFCTPPSEANWVDADKEADCKDDNPDINPGLPDDENWRCDGLDNDCDGTTDEVCCSGGASPVQIGSQMTDQSHPTLLPVASAAPEDARWLVAWAEASQLKLQHLDAEGKKIGEGRKSFVGAINSLSVSRHKSGYIAFVATQAGQVKSARFDSALTDQGGGKTVNDKVPLGIGGVSTATTGSTAWVAFSFQRKNDAKHVVKLAGLDLSTGKVRKGPSRISGPNPLPQAVRPVSAIVDGGPAVAWWDKANESVKGVRASDGKVAESFWIPVGTTTAGFDERIELIAHQDQSLLVFPDYDSSGTPSLRYRLVASTETGKLDGPTPALAKGNEAHHQPSARTVDADGDGKADRLLAVWAKGAKDDPAIMVGQTSLSSPGILQGTEVEGSGDEIVQPVLGRSAGRAGAVFLETDGVDNTKYLPLSIDAQPICSP